MADISALGEMKQVEPLDLDNYAENKEFTAIPKAGRYTVQAPSSFPQAAFGRSQANALTAQIDPTIIGPTNEGYQLRYTKVSAKTFKRNNITVSQLGDYLKAVGVRGRFTDEAALADAVEQTANQVYQVDIDWRAYNKDTKYALEGMTRFPSDGNGGYLPWTEDPNAKDPQTGEPVRLRANVTVVRFVPAGQ